MTSNPKYLFSSESVSEGHPDKICDQISDAILDAFLEKDKNSRVAIECFVKNNFLLIGGEISSQANLTENQIKEIARKTIIDIGYNKQEYLFDGNTCEIKTILSKQSPDISMGVDSINKEQGAGDQGLMFGYATNETPELMPLPIILSHKLLLKISELRKNKTIPYLRPDSKCQITVEYNQDKPSRIHTIVISTQHDENISIENLKKDLIKQAIIPVCNQYMDNKTIIYINPTGRFVLGGPAADTGLTGRKIIVDSYGGTGRHGGGCFSGKDPSKVDRSGAYLARYIAKNIVASNLADKCEIQIAYSIGLSDPVSLYINCFNTNKIPEYKIIELIKKNFPLKPKEIIEHLNLNSPIYKKTSCYGHFGRNEFPWEKTDKVQKLNLEINNSPR